MKANFTSKFKTIVKAFVLASAFLFIGEKANAQAQLTPSITYYVDGSGIDLVAPKDTFKDLSGTYTGTRWVTAYGTNTGIMNALTLNGTDSTAFGTINIILAPGYVGYKEPNLINVGDATNGGYPYQGSNRPIVLKPASGYYDTIVSTTAAGTNSLWKFNGIQFFTIDGQGTSGQRNITFKMGSNSTGAANIINIVSPSVSGSGTQYITIKNCNFVGNSTSSAINTWGAIVLAAGATHGNNNKTSQFITIQNNIITAVQNGIYIRGNGSTPTSDCDRSLNITNNIIGGTIAPGGSTPTDYVGYGTGSAGIYLSSQINAVIQGNTIRNSFSGSAAGGGFSAILLDNAAGTYALDSNIFIDKNIIYNINTAVSGKGSSGINISLGTHTNPSAIVISNNTIANISSPGSANSNMTSNSVPAAIMIQDNASDAGIYILHNSINMYKSVLSGASIMYSTCIWLGTNVTGGVVLQNNILANRQGRTSNNYAGAITYGIVANSVSGSPFSSIDGNVYSINTTDGGYAFLGYSGANSGTQLVSINHWRLFTVMDTNSITALVPYISDTLLQLNSTTPSLISNAGISGSGISYDINGNTRPFANPSAGAYQFTSSASNVNNNLFGGSVYQINGTKSWPTAISPYNGSFTNLTEAITYVNAYGVTGSGNVTLELQSSYPGEGTNYIPAIIDFPNQNANRPLYITVHSGVWDTISIPNQLNFANCGVLRFVGARYVTVDGVNKNLAITVPPAASNNSTRVIAITPSALSATTDIAIMNCVISGSSTNAGSGVISTFAGIFAGGLFANTSELCGWNNNHTFSSNLIQAVQTGIYLRGNAVRGLQDENIAISHNIIGGTTPPGSALPTTYIGGAASKAGIHLKGILGSTVDGNIIRNSLPAYNDFRGIDIATDNEAGNDSLLFIQNNKIYNLLTSGQGNFGIKVNLGGDSLRQISIYNNFIGKITGTGSGNFSVVNPSAISIQATSLIGHLGISLYNNTVQMTGNSITSSSNGSNCLWIGNNIAGGIVVQNNLFANNLSGTTSANHANVFAIQCESAVNKPFYPSGGGKIDNNVYSLGGINGTSKFVGSSGTSTFLSLGTWVSSGTFRNFSQQDTFSFMFNVGFISDTLPDVLTKTAGPVVNGAAPLTFLNTDIYGTARYGTPGYTLIPAGTAPCIGAVEFAQPYARLVGGATYYINGDQNPPIYTAPGNGSFSTVNNAFQYINGFGVNSATAPANPITLLITSGYIGEGDTLISPLNSYPNMNANRYIILKTDSVRTITTEGGSNGIYSANSSLIRFSGASYFIIDGSINGSGSRDLTFALPSSDTVSTSKVIDFIPGNAGGVASTNVKIQNCNIIGFSTSSNIKTFAGIYSGGLTTPSNSSIPGTNNNRFTNNSINAVNYGIYLQGAASSKDSRDTINYNLIGGDIAPGGSLPTTYFGGINNASGIFLSAQANTVVDSNVIKNNHKSFNLNSGIRLSNVSTALFTDSNITISRNIIYNLKSTGAAVYGIYMNLGADSIKKIKIEQNWIANLSSIGTTGATSISQVNPIGILIDGSGSVRNIGLTIAYNSIHFGTSSTGTTAANAGSACLQFAPSITGGVSLVNNVLQNLLPNSQSSAKNFSVLVGANKSIFTSINTNDYYMYNNNAGSGLMAYNSSVTPVLLNTIPAIQSFTRMDTTSISFVVNNFISDTVLDLISNSSSVLVQRVKYNGAYPLDMFKRYRGNPSTIGACEWPSGTPLDSVAPRVYNYSNLSACSGGPWDVDIRVYSSQYITSDTLYYTVNGGAQQWTTTGTWTGGLSTTGFRRKHYTIPSQSSNSVILYYVSVNDNFGLNGTNATYPNTANSVDTIQTSISIFPYGYGFDGPNTSRWASQQISGTGSWILGSYGSTANPNYSTAYAAVKMAMFPAASLASGTASRLVSPCFDITSSMSLPTLRLWVTQNSDLPNSADSLIFSISVGGSSFQPLAGISRVDPNYIFPGWKQIDVCLKDYAWGPLVKIGIEGYSKHGNNIMIDSVMLIDNKISTPISPKTNTICHYDSLSLTVANSSFGATYQMYDILNNQFLGNPYIGTGSDMIMKAVNPNLDSVWIMIWVQNTLAPNSSSCWNFMDDTAKVKTMLYKNGPFAVQGPTYTGTMYAGTALRPDAAKVGDTLIYTVHPPTGFSNTDYGTKWDISSTSVQTIIGVPATSTSFTYPDPVTNTNGNYAIQVLQPDADSTFYMSINFRLLVSGVPAGCDSNLVRNIKVSSVPLTAFSNGGKDTSCRHAVVPFISTNTPNPITSPYTYLWDFGDGTTSTNSSVNKVYTSAGTYTVKLTETNNAGLPATVSKTFTVLPAPYSGFTNTRPCSGDTVVFTNNTTGAASYLWSYNSIFTPISTGSSTKKNPHFYLQAPGGDSGTFIVTLLATNTVGCTDTTVSTVQLFAKPHATFTVADHCLGSIVSITNNSHIAGITNSFGSVWDPGTGDPTFLSNNPTYRYTKNGTFNLKLTVTSNYGCVDSVSNVVTVYDKPRTSFAYDTTSTCVGTNVTFTNGTSYSGGNNKVQYLWDFGDQSVNSTALVPTHPYGALGNVRVTLFATDSVHGCKDSTVKNIQINETPVAQFQVATKGCMSTAIPFTNKSSFSNGLVVNYLWNFGDGNTTTTTNASHSYSTAGTYPVSLKATSASGCTNSTSGSLSISTSPVPKLHWDTTGLGYYAVRFTVTPSTFASYRYILDDGTGPYTAYRDTLPKHTYNVGGTHKVIVIVTDDNGCSGIDSSMNVYQSRGVGIATANASQFGVNIYPNPFTDATNVSYNLANTANVHIRVYDMIGRLVADMDNGSQSAGQHSATINAEKFSASTAAYMVRIQIDDVVITKQIIRMK